MPLNNILAINILYHIVLPLNILSLNMSTDSSHDEVTIAVTLSTSSPTFNLSSDTPFEIFMHARLVQSTHQGQSVTIAIDDTAFEGTDLDKGLNAVSVGALGPCFISTHDPERTISFGVFLPHYSQADVQKPNLRERGFRFLTIPGSGEEVVVSHKLRHDQLFKSTGLKHRGEILPGEVFKLRLNPHRMQPSWWCWGNLEGDLKGRDLHAWAKGDCMLSYYNEPPTKEEVEEGNYVLGEDADKMKVEDRGGWIEVEIC